MNGIVARFIFLGAVTITGLTTLQAKAEEITWETLPKLVRERNGRVASMREKTLAAKTLTKHTLRSFQPVVEAHAGYEKANQGNRRTNYFQSHYGIEGRLNVFAAGKDDQENRIQEARAKFAEESTRMTESEILFEARKLFLDWLLADDLARAHMDSLNENKKGSKAAARKISRGVGTTTDRIEFALHSKELDQAIESLQHEKLILQILLSGYLRLEKPEALTLRGDLDHFHDEAILKDLSSEISEAPSVLISDASMREFSAISAQSARWWTPSIDLYAGHYLLPQRDREFSDIRERRESVVGVELKFTLWDAGSQATSRSRGLLEEAQRLDTSQTRHQFASQTRAQQEDMKHAHEVLHLVEERKNLNGEYLKQSLSEYDRGVKQSPDVLGAFQRSLLFQEELSRAKYNYRIAQAKLLKDLGK
jgi:outer membrane protein